jgi:hypothetical protein
LGAITGVAAPSDAQVDRTLRDLGIGTTHGVLPIISCCKHQRAAASGKLTFLNPDRTLTMMSGGGVSYQQNGVWAPSKLQVAALNDGSGWQLSGVPINVSLTGSQGQAKDLSLNSGSVTVTSPSGAGPAVRIVLRNHTAQVIPFLRDPPASLFSVTVLDPTGAHAKIAKGEEWKFGPLDRTIFGHGPVWLPLPPEEDVVLWTWRVAEDFDMSMPGSYRVSMGGTFAFLDTAMCSNTANVIVGK